ncbi:MAG: PKD domain-containing protein [Candidatus Heimdallarchaeota archaeon]
MNKWLLGSLGTFGAGGLVVIVLAAQVAQVPQEQTPYIDFALTSEEWLVEVGQLVHFHIENATEGISHFFWEFHDGTPTQQVAGSVTSTEHAFAQPGQFLVTVIGASSHSITTIRTHPITVVPSLPTVELQASQTLVPEDQPLLLTATLATNQPLDATLVYEWNFGDGDYTIITSETGQAEVVHQYIQAGTYWAQVVVTGERGVRASDAVRINVTNVSPLAIAEISTPTPVEDELVLFDASQSTDTLSDQPSLRYLWDFGDGQMKEGLIQSHPYAAAGIYAATLTVLDNDGAANTAVINLEVQNQAPEFIEIEAANSTLLEGQTFIFYGNATDTPSDRAQLAYDWTFGTAGKTTSLISFIDGDLSIDATVTDDNDATMTSPAPFAAEIVNVPATISLVDATTTFNLTFIITGEKWHDVEFQVMQEDTVLKSVTLLRMPGDPWEQSITFMDLTLQLGSIWTILGSYTPENDPINGQPWGSTPARAIFAFADGSTYTAHHTFNAQHPAVYSWELPVNPLGWGFLADLAFWVHDPGQDAVDVSADFGGTVVTHSMPAATWGPTQGLVHLQGPIGNVSESPLHYWAIDEDGAQSAITPVPLVVATNNVTVISSFAPQVAIVGDTVASEDAWLTFSTTTQPMMNPQALTQTWLFGDGSGAVGSTVQHSYPVAGLYLVRVAVSDGLYTTMTSSVVEITNLAPSPSMTAPSQTYPDNPVHFAARNTTDTHSDQLTLTYWWDFGDGSSGTGIAPKHTYGHHGTYQVVLVVSDDQGAVSSISQEIQVLNQPPIIPDELAVQEDEGTTAVLDSQATDSLEDIAQLQFQWTLESITAQDRPISTFTLADGSYAGELTVIDPLGANLSVPFAVEITNDAPQGIILDHRVYGPTNRYLRVYGMITDSVYDQSALSYRWRFPANPASDFSEWISLPAGILDAAIPLHALDTQSHVLEFEISDSATSLVTATVLLVTEDTDGDLLPDFFEEQPALNSNVANPDTDGDGIADPFEDYQDEDSDWLLDATELYIGTNTTNPDTDGDGLWDGYNPLHGTGELLEATSPFDPDTDADLLSDGLEVLGWEITVEYADGRTQVELMTANPLELHSDTDAVNDTVEFLLAGNPWVADTDEDGLDDVVEAFVWQTALNQADTDHDSLNDYLEVTGWPDQVQYLLPTGEYSDLQSISYTSNPLSADSDEDGLADYQEKSLHGNPLSNDTDHDGLLDAAEHDYGTLVHKADSDGDALSDGLEVNGWSLTVRSRQTDGTYQTQTHPITTNPRDLTTTPDADQDGLSDLEEYQHGGDPASPDTDGDGLTDHEELTITKTPLNLAFQSQTETTSSLYLNQADVADLWMAEVAVQDQFGDSILFFSRNANNELVTWAPEIKIWDAKDWDFANNEPKTYVEYIWVGDDYFRIEYKALPKRTVYPDELGQAIADMEAYYDKLVVKFMGGSTLGYSSSLATVEPGYRVERLLQHHDIPGVNQFTSLENDLFDAYLSYFRDLNLGDWNRYWGKSPPSNAYERKFVWGPNDEYSMEVWYGDDSVAPAERRVPYGMRSWDYDDPAHLFTIEQIEHGSATRQSALTLRQCLEIWIGLKLQPVYKDQSAGLFGEFAGRTTALIADWIRAMAFDETNYERAETDENYSEMMETILARVRTLLPEAVQRGITLIDPPEDEPEEGEKEWWEVVSDVDLTDIVDGVLDVISDPLGFLGAVWDASIQAVSTLYDAAAQGIESAAEWGIDLWEWFWEEAPGAVDEGIKTVENVVQSVANLVIEAITQLIETTLTTTTGTRLNEAKNIISVALAVDLGTVAQEIWDDFSGSNPKTLLEAFSGIFGFAKPYLSLTQGGGIGGFISDTLNLPSPLDELVKLISPTPALTLLLEIVERIIQDWMESELKTLPAFQSMATIVSTDYFEGPKFANYGETVSLDSNEMPEDPSSPSKDMLQGVGVSNEAVAPIGDVIILMGANLQILKGTSEGRILFNVVGNFTAMLAGGFATLTGLEPRLALWTVLNALSRICVTMGDEAMEDTADTQLVFDGCGVAVGLINALVSQTFLDEKEGQIDFLVSGVWQSIIHAASEFLLDLPNTVANLVGIISSIFVHLSIVALRFSPFIAGLADLEEKFWIVTGNGLVMVQAIFALSWQFVTSVASLVPSPEQLAVRFVILELMDFGILASAIGV